MHGERNNYKAERKIKDLLPDGKITGHVFRVSVQDYTYTGDKKHDSWLSKIKKFLKRKMNKGWSNGDIH